MRIDFVGNSHLGTISMALTKLSGDHDVAHFVSRTYGTVDATLVGTEGSATLTYIKLTDPAKFGHTIQLSDCDLVVVVGLNFSLVQVVKLWESFQPVEAIGDYGVPSLSEDLWNAYVDAAFDGTFMLRTLHKLRQLGGPPAAAIPQPAPAEWVSTRQGESFAIYHELLANGDWPRVLSDFERQVRRLEDSGVRVFRQPLSTLAQNGFTENEFAMGDPSDTSEESFYARGDFYHMNNEYAGRVASEFYDWVDAIASPAESAVDESWQVHQPGAGRA